MNLNQISFVILVFIFIRNGETIRMLNQKIARGTYDIKAFAIVKGLYDGSKISGTVTFTQTISEGKVSPILAKVNLTGFPQSLNKLHGLHIHWSAMESLSDDPLEYCAKTGPHFNPFNLTHGDLESEVRHLGDYGNVESKNGSILATLKDFGNLLYGPNSIIGRSVVLHRNEDDLGRKTDQGSRASGNSGPRIACGVIGHVFSVEEQERLIKININSDHIERLKYKMNTRIKNRNEIYSINRQKLKRLYNKNAIRKLEY